MAIKAELCPIELFDSKNEEHQKTIQLTTQVQLILVSSRRDIV